MKVGCTSGTYTSVASGQVPRRASAGIRAVGHLALDDGASGRLR